MIDIIASVIEIEEAWGHSRDEWGFAGPIELTDDERIWFCDKDGRGIQAHRFADEQWYCCSDETFEPADCVFDSRND